MKSTKVYPASKSTLEKLKGNLNLKSEADVIAYLIEHHNDRWSSITMQQDRNYRDAVRSQRDGYQMSIEDVKK